MFQFNVLHEFNTSYYLAFSKNSKFLARVSNKVNVYHPQSFKEITTLTKPSNPSIVLFTDDEQFLIIKSTVGTIVVYDTEKFEVQLIFKSNKSLKLSEGPFFFDHSTNCIIDSVVKNGSPQIAMLNIINGEIKTISTYHDGTTISCSHSSKPNRYFTKYVVNKTTGWLQSQLLIMDEAGIITILESKLVNEWDGICYSSIRNKFIMFKDNELLLIDDSINKVENRLTFSLDSGEYSTHRMQLSRTEEYLLMTFNKTIYIVDINNFEIIYSIKLQYACFAAFTQDDNHLLIGTWEKGYVVENPLKEH